MFNLADQDNKNIEIDIKQIIEDYQILSNSEFIDKKIGAIEMIFDVLSNELFDFQEKLMRISLRSHQAKT